MNTKNNFLITLLGFAAIGTTLFLSSCEKEEDDHDHVSTDTEAPQIAITSPASMQVYYSGDTVRVRGTVSDASLHELMLKITRDTDNSVLWSETPTVHDMNTYTLNTWWKSQVSDHTNARLIVIASDHSNNVSSDTVRIHIMP